MNLKYGRSPTPQPAEDLMSLPVGDVLYWLITYLEFINLFTNEGKGGLNENEDGTNWKCHSFDLY